MAHRGRGIGRLLLNTVARHLRESGLPNMLLWVLTINHSARAFYESCGGRAVRERDIDFGGKAFNELGYGWPDLGQVR